MKKKSANATTQKKVRGILNATTRHFFQKKSQRKLNFLMLLTSCRAKSGYKYVIYDKQAKVDAKWKVQFKKKRSHGFSNPRDAAHHLLHIHPELIDESKCDHTASSSSETSNPIKCSKNGSSLSDWWERNSISDDLQMRMSLFGIRIVMFDQEQVTMPKSIEAKKLFVASKGIPTINTMKAGELNNLVRAWLQKQTGSQLMSIAQLWRLKYGKFTYNERKGTVVGFSPLSLQHSILFDDDNVNMYDKHNNVIPAKTFTFDLLDARNWKRIPWNDNVLDPNESIGEKVSTLSSIICFSDIGPECPQCRGSLGIGISAWSKCHICGLNEPGVMWSTRFKSIRTNPYAVSPIVYGEADNYGDDDD